MSFWLSVAGTLAAYFTLIWVIERFWIIDITVHRKFLRVAIQRRRKRSDSTTPSITPELAKRLDREGSELRREYEKRLHQMWNVDRGKK